MKELSFKSLLLNFLAEYHWPVITSLSLGFFFYKMGLKMYSLQLFSSSEMRCAMSWLRAWGGI